MIINREWATPLTIGAFLISALTGVLMFFHLDSGLNKNAHEWLGWLLVLGAGSHVVVNWPAFKRYFGKPAGRVLIGLCAAVTVASFVRPPASKGKGGGGNRATDALVAAPLSALAPIVGQPPEELLRRLRARGATVVDASQSLTAIAQASG